MNILLTNDDGIESQGILKLAEALRSRDKDTVNILAPDSDRSAISHGFSLLKNPLRLVKKTDDTWTCSGTPVDCVILAVLGALPCKPDVIISGINHGPNIGTDIIYSGTAAAARQGALMGIPSIAVSLDGREKYNWAMAAKCFSDHLDEFINIWKDDIFVNVNIPNSEEGPDGVAVTWPARNKYNDTLSNIKHGNKDWFLLDWGNETFEDHKGTDRDAVSNNKISISPVYIHPVVRMDLCPDAQDYAAVGKRGG